MFLVVTNVGGALKPDIRDAENFHELKVVINQGVALEDARTALSNIGELGPDGELWIRIAVLEQLAETVVDSTSETSRWGEKFSEMIDYAANHGWVDRDRQLVAVHCEIDGEKINLGGACRKGGDA